MKEHAPPMKAEASPVEKKHKLNWKILGRRTVLLSGQGGLPNEEIEYIDVEWTHADGPVSDFEMRPVTHPPNIEYAWTKVGERKTIPDQINVKPGTPASVIAMTLEERRERLAKNLGVEP